MRLLTLVALLPLLAVAASDAQCGDSTFRVLPSVPDALHGTQSLVRAHLASCNPESSSGTVTVHLAAGTHRITRPLVLTSEDTHPSLRVVYQGEGEAAGFADPPSSIVSGGMNVPSWRVHPTNPKLVVSAAPVPRSRLFFVDGERIHRTAASPAEAGLSAATAIATDNGILTNSSLPLTWLHPETVELVFDSYDYPISRCRVTGVEPSGTGQWLVRVVQPCWSFGRANAAIGLPTSVENTGGFRASGQFWFDPAGKLVHYPTDAAALLSNASVGTVAVSEGLVFAHGVRNVEWRRISFEYSGYNGPSGPQGYLERYGGTNKRTCPTPDEPEYDWLECFSPAEGSTAACSGNCSLYMVPAAFELRASSNATVTDCAFLRLGSWGVSMGEGTSDSAIARSHLRDISGGGIYLANINETSTTDPTKQLRNVAVTDNIIEWVGVEYMGAGGVTMFSAVNTSIQYNWIRYTAYSAVSMPWPAYQGSAFNRDNTLRSNDVDHAVWYGRDGGSLHTLSDNPGTLIVGNYFHDQTRGDHMTYIDNLSSDLTIQDHVVDNPPANGAQYWLYFQQCCDPKNRTDCYNCGTNNHASHCFVRGSPPSPFDYSLHNNSVTDITYVKEGQDFPAAAQAIIDKAGPRREQVGEVPDSAAADAYMHSYVTTEIMNHGGEAIISLYLNKGF